MSHAAAPADPPVAPERRPRLRAVRPPVPDPPAGSAAAPLVLRRLPQPQPEPWCPGQEGSDAPRGAGRTATPVTDRTSRHPVGQQAFVLHGLPRAVAEPDDAAPVPTASSDLPCPELLARSLVQAVMDVVRGHRPASQVLRWTTPEVYSHLRQRARLEQAGARPGGRRPVVRSLRTSPCGPGGVEVSAVVLDGNRARAVAARLDGEDARWRMTALVIG